MRSARTLSSPIASSIPSTNSSARSTCDRGLCPSAPVHLRATPERSERGGSEATKGDGTKFTMKKVVPDRGRPCQMYASSSWRLLIPVRNLTSFSARSCHPTSTATACTLR
eukprot:515975-Rhodomonas_salina.2